MPKQKYIGYRERATLAVSTKRRNDYADYDYINILDDKTLKWIKGFNREFVNADFSHKYKKIHKKKKQKLDCYGKNNYRNRCLYNLKKVTYKLRLYYDLTKAEENNYMNHYFIKELNENYLITMIDNKS